MYKGPYMFLLRLLSNVRAFRYKRSERNVAGLSPSFATIDDKKVHFSYKCQQNYTQRAYRETQLYAKIKSTSVNVTEQTIKMLLNVATININIISSTSKV
jgi:hypothetical protein